MEKIYNYNGGVLGIVHHEEIKVGDIFQDGRNQVENRPQFKQVTKINEQRKERGVRVNEKDRRQWAKVDTVNCEPPKV